MVSVEQMAAVLKTLPDPAFILSQSGKYIAAFGGRDTRYYHDGSGLVGSFITDVVKPEKAQLFLEIIDQALESEALLITEYELSGKDIEGLSGEGPACPVWFEARVQALDFLVDNEPVVLWVASNISERHELEVRLREQSNTDQLTGLFNRRKLERDLALHYETFERHAVPTSILMFDLDNLKTINDTLGHHAGDEVISAIGDTCRLELRKTDIACRFGGDEFVIALPNTTLEHALDFAGRFRGHCERELRKILAGDLTTSISIGVATMVSSDGFYEGTVKRADGALYEAKRGGKNRVVAATDNLLSKDTG